MGIAGFQAQAHLGRYELLARLATGGMGEIFLARLEGAAGFEKLYVVKRILPHLADDARFRQMLIAEARIASRLAHANICQVYELGETEGQLYIVMEYLEGVTLLPLLRRASKRAASLDLGLAAGVVQQVCEALHYAHELKDNRESLGLVHRDVTPSNIFLTESGVVKVLDFGIAKAKGASTQTQEGTVKGKYAYMAPEQLRGGNIDRRVDVFALGVVVFEMLALRKLFQRKTDYLTFRAVMEQPIPDIRRYRPDVPEAVAAVLSRALERDADARFESARQLGTALLDALSGRPWTQGEIGDFVHSNFMDELGRRSAQVQVAVQRVGATSGVGRSTMPMIAHDEGGGHEGDDDDESFPSVETDIDNIAPTPPRMALQPRAPSSPAEFVEGTPPPFGGDTSEQGLRPIQPIVASSMGGQTQVSAPVIVMARRSIVWPLLAVAMVAIAGGALYLVYKQTQQAPTVVRIEQTPANNSEPPVKASDLGSGSASGSNTATGPSALQDPPAPDSKASGSGSQTASKQHLGSAHTPRAGDPSETPYRVAFLTRKDDLQRCIDEHSATDTPDTGQAAISLTSSGRVKSVTWTPSALDASPLGACLKNVVIAIQFPKAAADSVYTQPLTFHRSR